ncbi:MAG TPA: C25 family cysteine peptidase [Candidatus Limnocylindria bacterium]|nr:C25 family cysteine peptidase [Candidatus Limnocylindria bacterium]
MKVLRVLLALAATCAAATLEASPTTLEREFSYPAERFSLVPAGGTVDVRVAGESSREFTPGRPDLPMLAEAIEIPAGMRVTGVEVVNVDAELWERSIRVPPAVRIRPGITPIERTAADPAVYGLGGFLPQHPAEFATQGSLRGRNVAWIRVNPVRWEPSSGRLEQVRRVKVRLQIEPHHDPGQVVRERVVPEWEDQDPTAARADDGGRGAQPFRATQVPSVLGSPVAYVIVTSDALAPEFQRLADWKTQSGLPAVVRTLSFIRQQYPSGADDADRIRQFLRDAYARWGTKWVLLGGDTEVIPARLIYTRFYGGEYIPADLYFSCLDGNWNADGDSLYGEGYLSIVDPGDNADLMPDVYVGRAPVVTVAQVDQFIDKTLQYAKTPVGDYEQSVLFFAEVLFPQDWVLNDPTPSLDGAELVEEVLPYLNAAPGIHYARLYQNYLDPRWAPGALAESRAVVLDSLDAGYNLAVHIGHGYRNVMSVGDNNLSNEDALGLTNGNRLSNLYAINCTSNAIDFPCIGEAFLLAPNGGAVTNIGSTRFDFPTAGRNYQKEYFKLVFDSLVTAVGEAQARQKLPFIPFSTYDGVNRWTEMTLLLIGDPELRMYTRRPAALSAAHAASMAAGDTTFSVTVTVGGSPVNGAKVTAYKVDDDYRSAFTNASGIAVLNFRPDETGSFTLTATSFNAKPYQATLNVTPAGPPVLAEQNVVIDDDAAGGTSGNADTFWNAGETVDLTIPLRNTGGAAANAVTGKLSTGDALVTVVNANATYGSIGTGATVNGTAYRLSIPFTAQDQREIPLALRFVDNAGRSWADTVQVVIRSPEPRHFSHNLVDQGGNSNQRPDPGEVNSYFVKLRNLGTGPARNVTAVLRNLNPALATVTDSTGAFGDIDPLAEAQGDQMLFTISDTLATFQLRVSDIHGLLYTQAVDVRWPGKVLSVAGRGSGTSIDVTWWRRPEPDLLGYNVYRGLTAGGPFTRVNLVPTDRTAYFRDIGLAPLTQYFYRVAAVDSSGNESTLSDVVMTSTNPPNHVFWPHETSQRALSSVAIEYMYQANQMDIAMASDIVYLWHADGLAPVDADGSSATSGDFSLAGQSSGAGFRSGPSIGQLDTGALEVVAAAWDSAAVYVLDDAGAVKPGWPFYTTGGNLDQRRIWSGVAIGDLNNDGSKELVFGSNGYNLYAMRANGQEWRDGDATSATKGVFKAFGSPFNYGTPALVNLDGDGGNQLEIIYGGYDGNLYAFRHDGTNVFPPVPLGVPITSSAAVGYLDGPGDSGFEIVISAVNDSLYVFNNLGVRRNGWPVHSRAQGGSDMQTSPALADINNDGFVDIVHATSDGFIKVYNRDGTLQPAFANVRYSTASSPASASSPVVGDISGDGLPDIVMGDNAATLTAISGTGQVLAGFPIVLPAEVYGTPAVCDCDSDGLSEIVVANNDGKVYMWDYDFPFSPGRLPPWPQFHHDARRTGLYNSQVFVDVEPAPTGGAAPSALEFSAPAPNPAARSSRLSYAVPSDLVGGELELAVYDLLGRKVRTLASGRAAAGRFSVEWNLRGDQGEAVGGGIYFAKLRLGAQQQSRKLVVLP